MAYKIPPYSIPDWFGKARSPQNLLNDKLGAPTPWANAEYIDPYFGTYNGLEMSETLPIPEEEEIPPIKIAKTQTPGYVNDTLWYEDNTNPLEQSANNSSETIISNKSNVGDYIKSGLDIASWVGSMIGDIRNSSRSSINEPSYMNYNTNAYNRASDLKNLNQKRIDVNSIKHPDAMTEGLNFHKQALTGAAKGAVLGSQIMPGWGTAIGAIAGGVVGSIGAGINTATKMATYNSDKRKAINLNRTYRNNFLDAQNDVLQNIRTSTNNMMNNQRLTNTYAGGGQMQDVGFQNVEVFNNGGTHEENPNNGIPQGIGANGQPNLVEEGEVKWNDFIFSNRIKPDRNVLGQHNTAMNKDFDTYADMAKYIIELHKEREGNPFDQNTMNIQMERLSQAQEYQKVAEEAAQYGLSPEEYMQYQQQAQQNQFAEGGNLFKEGGPINKDTGLYIVRPNTEGFDKLISKKSRQTKSTHKQACYRIGQFAYYRAELNRQLNSWRQYYNILENANSEEELLNALKNLSEIASELKKINNLYNEQLKGIRHVFAYYKVVDKLEQKYPGEFKDDKNAGDHVRRLREYLQEVGGFSSGEESMFYQNNLINKSLNNYYVDLLKRDANSFYDKGQLFTINPRPNSRGVDAFDKTDSDLVNAPEISINNDAYKTFELQFNNINSFFNAAYQSQDSQSSPGNIAQTYSNSAPSTANAPSASYRDNVSVSSTTHATTPRATSDKRYWSPTKGKFVTNLTEDPDAYEITTKPGTRMDGYINYEAGNNNKYIIGRDSLTTEDWTEIKNRLQAYNQYYKQFDDIDWYKTNSLDHKFGPVHKIIMQYLAEKGAAAQAQEDIPNNIIAEDPEDTVAVDGKEVTSEGISDETLNDNDEQIIGNKYNYYDWMRYAPVLNNIRQVLEQNEPDFTYSNQLASLYKPQSYRPTGQYQRYQPVDQHYNDVQANQQRNTLYGLYKGNTPNASVANAYATMAANTAKSAQNDAYIKAVQANNQMRNAAIAYNNQIDSANETARRNVETQNYQNWRNAMYQSYTAAEQEKLAVEQAREANLQNLALNLADIGREETDKWRIDIDPTNAYTWDMMYKGYIPYFMSTEQNNLDTRVSEVGGGTRSKTKK